MEVESDVIATNPTVEIPMSDGIPEATVTLMSGPAQIAGGDFLDSDVTAVLDTTLANEFSEAQGKYFNGDFIEAEKKAAHALLEEQQTQLIKIMNSKNLGTTTWFDPVKKQNEELVEANTDSLENIVFDEIQDLESFDFKKMIAKPKRKKDDPPRVKPNYHKVIAWVNNLSADTLLLELVEASDSLHLDEENRLWLSREQDEYSNPLLQYKEGKGYLDASSFTFSILTQILEKYKCTVTGPNGDPYIGSNYKFSIKIGIYNFHIIGVSLTEVLIRTLLALKVTNA